MAVTTKLSVDISGFRSGMQEAQQSVKTLDAAMKKNEAQFKATGNAEEYMSNKANILNQRMQSQEKIAKNAANAMAEMNKNGVDPASKEYQKLAQTLLNAEAAMMETQAALNELDTSATKAADSANELVQGVNGISKKISLDQVISGINTITGGLEKGAQKAKELGEALWNDIMDSARWADDTAAMALMYGIDLDTFQRMQKLVQNGMDTSVDAILNSQTKLKRGIGDGNEKVLEYMRQLGLLRTSQGKYGETETLISEDTTELFWEAGRALMAMGKEYDKEAAAQALFGRGWKELVPLFTEYKSLEEYNAALAEVNVNSEEDVERLAELNDKVGELQGNFQTLKNEVLAELAPALTGAAESLNGLLQSLLDYLKTPEGQKMLEDLGTAVSGLFEDLGKIDPETVVEGFVGVFNTVIGSLQWLWEHKDEVVTALEGIVIGWGALKLAGGALEVLKLVEGISGLSSNAAAAGAAAGASWGSAFASAVAAAAPWLIGLWTLINPADTNAGEMAGANGLTTEGHYAFLAQAMENQEYKSFLMELGEWYGDRLFNVLNNTKATGEIWNYLLNGKNGYSTEGFVRNVLMPMGFGNFEEGYRGVDFNEEDLNNILRTLDPTLTPKFEVENNAAEKIAEDVGTVEIPCVLVPGAFGYGDFGGAGGGGYNVPEEHANGLWSVPYDGYLARLHKGERVLPAREVSSRNFSSNLYVESMVMSGGADAAGLAAAMAAAQKRTMAGYGS